MGASERPSHAPESSAPWGRELGVGPASSSSPGDGSTSGAAGGRRDPRSHLGRIVGLIEAGATPDHGRS